MDFLSDIDFSVAIVQSKKQNTFFPIKTSFYLYKSVRDKKEKKVCGSEGRTSVTNCGIKMRKQRSAYKKKRSMLINNVNKKKK